MKAGVRAIPVAKPSMGDAEVEAAARVIRSGWVTQGPEVAAFEREFATYVGAPHACAVSSATTALHLALLAAGVGPGDEVVTVSHSFIATANVVRYCGAVPVFVDVQPGTFNIDPTRIDGVITPRTRAILCVHQMGMPCDLASIIALARRRGLVVVEDAACAAGSEIRWQGQWERIGRPHGDLACFSFHPRKLVATGDGGMVTTASAETDARLRLWRQHGMSVPDTARHASAQVIFESYPVLGFNYRMTDIQAAVGREQLKRLPDAVARRRALARRFMEGLADVPDLSLPIEPEWARTNWQSFCVRLSDRLDQRRVMQALLDEGISTRRGVMCAHREASYPPEAWTCAPEGRNCECAPGSCERLRESERSQDQGIILPLFGEMSHDDQDRVIAVLASVCRFG
jgi:dTDP-4-amino-4,6-dideoxygalactose transaminase